VKTRKVRTKKFYNIGPWTAKDVSHTVSIISRRKRYQTISNHELVSRGRHCKTFYGRN